MTRARRPQDSPRPSRPAPPRKTRRPRERAPRPLRRVLPHARRFLRQRRRAVLLLGGWSLLESVQTFLGGYSVARALDQGFLAGDTRAGLGWLAVGAVAVLVGGLATRGVFRHLADLVEPLRNGLMRRVVTRALRQAVADPARADSAAVSRLTSQTEIARDGFAGLVLVTRSFAFTAVGALFGLAALAPELLLVVLPPLVLGLVLFGLTLGPTALRQQEFLRADEAACERFGAVAAGMRDVTACGAERRLAAESDALVGRAQDTGRSLARWAAVRHLALGTSGQLPVVLLLVAAPWLLRNGVTAGELMGALTYLTQSLLPALHTLVNALGSAGTRLLVVLDRLAGGEETGGEPPSAAPDRPAPRPVPALRAVQPGGTGPRDQQRRQGRPGPPRVELRSVTFAYGPGARPVLRDLDLEVPAGGSLAVVGPSGIGKSTLAGLVAGVLRPVRGEVRVNGEPPHRYPCPSQEPAWRRVLIPQEAYVFTGSLDANLRYLAPQGASSRDVRDSALAVGLGPLLERLGGLDAPVSPAELSLGERQLVALARAHLSPAPLLLLDEATCHLDPVAEARAERALLDRPGTVLVVAHRISSARRADRVLVLDGTRAMCGSHRELLARSPLYGELVGHWRAPAV